jgi:hypothetical protein
MKKQLSGEELLVLNILKMGVYKKLTREPLFC